MKMNVTKVLILMNIALLLACSKKKPEEEETAPAVNIPRAVPNSDNDSDYKSKEVYIPSDIWGIPPNNDFNNNTSEYSNKRKLETENFAFYWSNFFGNDLGSILNIDYAAPELERFYKYYLEKLKFVSKGSSLTDKYKMLVFIRNTTDGNAYGGGAKDSVGAFWIPGSRLGEKPFAVAAHELGHCFQYMVHADGAWGFSTNPPGGTGQVIFEMTSQFMAWQVYPEWMTFENYHLVEFLSNTHLASMHEDMRYAAPFILEYWADKHGIEFVGKLWREAVRPEDPIAAYKRIQNLNQQQLNDEMFDAARKFITWDIPLIKQSEATKYANKHYSELNALGDGWYRIAASNCPQNYGYNGIKLAVPSAGTKVTVSFKGVAGSQGFRAINVADAGWRYGFVAYKSDGSRVYSNMFSDSEGSADFDVPANTQYLWLVVSGAPSIHRAHLWDDNENNDEQWPYQVKLTGTALDPSMVN